MTHEEFNRTCGELCSKCRGGKMKLRYRPETSEYVHEGWEGKGYMHIYCMATTFRKANEGQVDG